ncbi:MAG TPA: hypothetical protein PKD64_16805 [Pirellulaceae bacterium]|nr:hypothetical protein [Pirellulaceae bacterium]HMO93848.1 hypothetical protein [Pirellulaceae bacterium]HMP71144.1 hypothetical protein [Pirellulaceae bacterium]
MKRLFLVGIIAFTTVGCQQKTISDSNLKTVDRTADLVRQVREAILAPEVLKIEQTPERRIGYIGWMRELRQVEVAEPLIRQLVECGKPAVEPLWQLINDDDDDIRRSCVYLLSSRLLKGRHDALGEPISEQHLLDVNIPVLERALNSHDAEVRWFASNVGCLHIVDDSWSDQYIEVLTTLVPKLRALKDDPVAQVRSQAYSNSEIMLLVLYNHAKNDAQRQAVELQREQLRLEKKW